MIINSSINFCTINYGILIKVILFMKIIILKSQNKVII